MCVLHAYRKENDKSSDATNFGGGRPIPYNSTRISLVYLCVSINFIETWLNILDNVLHGVVVPIKIRQKSI